MTDRQEQSGSAMVAEVDGRAVTLGEVGDAIRALPASVNALPFSALFPTVLEQLVRQQALVIRAQQQGLDEDPAIRRKMKAAADRVLADELLRQEISPSITDASLLDRYTREIAGKPGQEEVHLRVIMVRDEALGNDIIAELRGGADFATTAKRSSQDATAEEGGDLGFVQRDRLNAEIAAAAFVTQPGRFTPFPVRSAGSWFVIKVEERRRQSPPSFLAAREQLIRATLRERAPQAVRNALANVTIREYTILGKEVPIIKGGGTLSR